MEDRRGKDSYILWLPSWYPTTIAPYDGDFIQRHAQAVSAFVPLHVLYFIKDEKGIVTNSVHIDEKIYGDLKETIVYYNVKKRALKFHGKIIAFRKFKNLYKKTINELFKKSGKPQLVHVHVAFKAGLIARWIRRKFRIPYFLTEHWTIYLEEAVPNLNTLSFVYRRAIGKVIKEALLILPVSDYLGRSLQKRFPFISYKVLPNVVNTKIFYPAEKSSKDKLRLIHVSALDHQKDPEKLFQAIGLFKKKNIKFSLDVFGPVSNQVINLLQKEMIEGEVVLHGEVPQSELASYIRNSDALILYSRYETFGCVLIEANASGIPVIVPDIPVMRELVTNNNNGILIRPNDAEALAQGLEQLVVKKEKFDSHQIVVSTKEKFSYPVIGKQLYELYKEILEK